MSNPNYFSLLDEMRNDFNSISRIGDKWVVAMYVDAYDDSSLDHTYADTLQDAITKAYLKWSKR